ncbi:conserved protein of unknown function [Candidatus Hydrogenisulfobacillus filiaventi]|uniref:Uncharacterized protein n=1 Tax=Candidatus Hydrogenisulfobacillus filiaventi TaxID=2707344 RepID=A0A6F8ZE64_9FIRM|nr:hypothetical protein [Bacillota bacterium]CAB1128045.1 conserved protein of unknown function [Candidatus Hydrogenisulfobacillus filiaventi]
MERRSRFGGFDLHVKADQAGLHVEWTRDPEYVEARHEVFDLFDRLRTEARRNGVSPLELALHAMKRQWEAFNAMPRRK